MSLPSTVSQKEKDQMASLIALMNANGADEEVETTTGMVVEGFEDSYDATGAKAPVVATQAYAGLSPDAMAMKNILQSFNAAIGETTKTMLVEARDDDEMASLLETERTPHGIRQGKFEIRKRLSENRSGKTKDVFDIIDSHGMVLAEEMFLYEACQIIVKSLNKGQKFNSPAVRSAMALEEAYVRNRNDAIRFRRKAKELYAARKNDQGSIFEARFDRSRTEALRIQEELKRIAERL
jgi:hypothetical protein